MSENRIVKAQYSKKGFCRTRAIFQYNYGQVLKLEGFPEGMLPAAYEVHFDIGNNQSVPMIGDEDGVDIPDICLTGGIEVNAWLFLHDTENDGETRFEISIPLKPRAEPTDIETTPVQQDAITQTIAALNAGVGRVREVENTISDTVAAALQEAKESGKQYALRVTSLTQIPVASGQIVDSVGIPVYVDDVSEYAGYGITDTGWYAFVRIASKEDVAVSTQTAVTGADGYIATIGADHVDVAVRFGVAAQSKTVTIAWGNNETETFVFRATDLAVRNLDYRSTFYIYDIADFAAWTWALTTDATFQSGVDYYTESGGEYTLATVTVGDAVPAETYYVHTKLTFSGMIRNVTYRFNETVDCPIEIVLPEVPDDGYGAWFEIQMRYGKQVSTTLIPSDSTVVIGTAQTQAQSAGINVIDLQYSDVDGVKMWTLLNTHSNLPSSGGT